MKVFVSSLISGFETYRSAVVEAAETLGHQVIRAEDFAASTGTPQQACLSAVRQCDVVVLLIGEHYGYIQPSGLSATHEEYREAKERKPILVFVESGVTREPPQQALLDEVQAWSTGHFRAGFASPDELKTVVLRALHEHELATASGSVDENDLLARATELLADNGRLSRSGSQLVYSLAGGPYQQVLRPVELEQADLSRDVQREALFGDYPVLDPSKGTNIAIRDGALVLDQGGASLLLNEAGSIRIIQPTHRDSDYRAGLVALIEEDLVAALTHAIRISGWLLDRIDPLHRITDVVPLAQISGSGYMPWRTRAEHVANPTSMTMRGKGDNVLAQLTPARRHRQALLHDAARVAEDMIALLRRGVGQ